MTLASLLRRELRTNTLRELEARTGVSHTELSRLSKNQLRTLPKLTTLAKLAAAFGIPRWRMLELAGFELFLPSNDIVLAQQLASLIGANPLYRRFYACVADADEDELGAALAFLEVSVSQRRSSVGRSATEQPAAD